MKKKPEILKFMESLRIYLRNNLKMKILNFCRVEIYEQKLHEKS